VEDPSYSRYLFDLDSVSTLRRCLLETAATGRIRGHSPGPLGGYPGGFWIFMDALRP
jgi:hypothetical protein